MLTLTAVCGAGGAAAKPLTDCRVAGLRHGVKCGVLQRPLDPGQPGGASIELHFVVVPAIARRKLPDPVFVLAGGPGQSAIRLAPSLTAPLRRLNNRRDIVLVDQRGTGRSAPLECDEPPHASLAELADPQRPVQRALRCLQELLTLPYVRGPDGLRHFTTPVAMQDLEAVREQLAAPRINLIGASYGTRAALEYQRQFPSRVRRSVLDGVAPPDLLLSASFGIDGQAAFEALLASCETEAACSRAFPTLRADWEFLLAGLPRPVTLPHPLTGVPERFELTRAMVLSAIRGLLYSPAWAAGLPGAIVEAAQGRPVALLGLASLLSASPAAQISMGMHFSVVCAEDLPLPVPTSTAATEKSDFGRDELQMYRQVCAKWPRGKVPAEFHSLPASKAAVLLLSGGLDPATPPRHGARVAQALGPLARHVVVANAGHGVMALPCVRELVFRFIDAVDDRDAVALEAGCAADVPRPPAFLPVSPAAQWPQ
jgi:pimeloyl-ACP methyl ester carboxylesterase